MVGKYLIERRYGKMAETDLIRRQAAIDALKAMAVPLYKDPACEDIWERDRTLDSAIDAIRGLPSAQPERMTNRQWIDFLSAQFDISRTSAKEMLHGMMQWKKEDNFKKLFNGEQDETD